MLVDCDLNILIAEDDERYVFFLERAFRDIPVKAPPHIVSDGDEAIAYLRGDGKYADRTQYPLPSLLFLDLKMPRLGGFDVLRWAFSNTSKTRRRWRGVYAVR